MKYIFPLITAFILVFSFAAFADAPLWNDPACYRSDYDLLDYDAGEPVYVIGHMTPDTDSVCSAIACAELRRQLGLNCEARIAGPVNNETAFALNCFGVDVPPILKDATGLQMILVDHCESSQAVPGITEATIFEIIDHHNYGDLRLSNQVLLNSAPVGSTCALVYRAFKECALNISPEIAGVLLSGLMSDTGNLNNRHSLLDEAAYADLVGIAGMDDPDAYFIELDKARLDYGDMTDEEIFFHDYKSYIVGDYAFGIGIVEFRGEELLDDYARRMTAVMEDVIDREPVNMLFAACSEKNTNVQYLVCCGDNALKAAELAEFGTLENDHIRISPGVSRKTVLVPGLTEILENVNLDEAA